MLEKFEQLMISEPVLRALNDMGFEEPTPIQQEAIPVAMSGKDMIGQAQTGTGKTAAFGLPVLERVDGNERHVQVVILSPTRELAIQVAEELNKMAQYTNITALPIYGGQDINRQFRALKKNPQIIVATPGRLMDHMDRGSIKFEDVKIVVLDEADEMLNMGFRDDIETILSGVPEERQTVLFSATTPTSPLFFEVSTSKSILALFPYTPTAPDASSIVPIPFTAPLEVFSKYIPNPLSVTLIVPPVPSK